MTPLFALVLTICSGNDCTDIVKGVYDTKPECEQVIYEERYFNASCYPVENIIRMGDLDVANLNP